MADIFSEETNIYCVLCSRRLGELPDDQPDWPNGPICGECYQAHQAEDEIWVAGVEGDV